jgi:ankyrin repeat protein
VTKGIDLDLRDNALMTPIMNSVIIGNDLAFVYLYFKGSCDLSGLDFNGNSMMHLAAESGSVNIARLLRHIYKLSQHIGLDRSKTHEHDNLIYFDLDRTNM